MKRGSRFLERGVQIGFFAALLWVWHVANVTGLVHPFLLPEISTVARAFVHIVAGGEFWPDLRITLFEYGVAFALASTSGLIAGFLVSRTSYTVGVFDPLFAGIYAIPLILLYPLYTLVFGLGPGSKIAMGATVAFFPIVLNTIAGLTTVDRAYIAAARSMGASPRQLFWMVMLPAAFPVILTGLRIGLILSLLAIIGTETIAGFGGLGRRIAVYAEEMDSPAMFGFIVFVLIIAVAFNVIASYIDALGRRKFQ